MLFTSLITVLLDAVVICVIQGIPKGEIAFSSIPDVPYSVSQCYASSSPEAVGGRHVMFAPFPFYFALGCSIIDILELFCLIAPADKNILI